MTSTSARTGICPWALPKRTWGTCSRQECLDVGNIGDSGANVETLTAPVVFAHQGFAYDHRIERHGERSDREPVDGGASR